MDIITQILAMVEEILLYVKEGEAAGIIEIIKEALAQFTF